MQSKSETELTNLIWLLYFFDTQVWQEGVPLHLWIWISIVFYIVFEEANWSVTIHQMNNDFVKVMAIHVWHLKIFLVNSIVSFVVTSILLGEWLEKKPFSSNSDLNVILFVCW
jgi:predicted cation transporter